MPLVNEELLQKDLIRDEGLCQKPYFDTKGFISFGIGRNLEANPLTETEREYGLEFGFNSAAFIFLLFSNDIKKTLSRLYQELPWIRNHPEQVQRALANMAFQMGVKGLLKFRKSLPLIENREYTEAAEEMKRSRWYRKDSPNRARRVIELVRSA